MKNSERFIEHLRGLIQVAGVPAVIREDNGNGFSRTGNGQEAAPTDAKPEAGAEKRLQDVAELVGFFQERGLNAAEAATVSASAIEVVLPGGTYRVRIEFVPVFPSQG